VTLFLLVGLVTVGENFFTTVFHITARGHIVLLAAPVVVYVAVNASGRGLWLLAALALFNVSVAGLFFGCIVAVEAVASLRRRSVSRALIIATACLVAAGTHTIWTGANRVVPPEAVSLGMVLSRIDALAFLPGIPILLLLAGAAYVSWRTPDPGGDLLLRAVVLSGLLAGAGQLRYALQSAGVNLVDPAAFNFILLSYYLGPLVSAAGIFLVMLGIAARRRDEVPAGLALNAQALSLVAAAVLALAAARATNIVGRPAEMLPAIGRAVSLVATTAPPASIDPLVVEAAAPGDRYLIGRAPGDAITMVSVLKMRTRAAAGLLKAADVSIVAVPRPSS
jgi:hypothetical protein